MNIYCVHMCTALNLAITERTGDRGVGRGGKQGIRCVCWGPLVFLRMVVPAGAASRVSAERSHKQGWDLKPGTTMAMGCNHYGNMRFLGKCPSQPGQTAPAGQKSDAQVSKQIRTSKINNPPTLIITLLQHDTKA